MRPNGRFTERPKVEFIQYSEVSKNLADQGVVEAADGDLMRLELEPSDSLRTIHVRDSSSRVQPYPDARVKERAKNDLPNLVEEILGRLHLTEVLVIPIRNWRSIIDTVAFDMAEDEDWIEMDAIAAMHQNTRNPLAVTRGETHVLIDMIRAIFNHGESPDQDLTITSDVTPVLIEIFPDGAVSVTSQAAICDEIDKSLGG